MTCQTGDRGGPGAAPVDVEAPNRSGRPTSPSIPLARESCTRPPSWTSIHDASLADPSTTNTYRSGTNAVAMAVARRAPEIDRRSCTSDGNAVHFLGYGKRLRGAGLLGSKGTGGDCYDNTMMESFWGTMQLEPLGPRIWNTAKEPINAIFEWIGRWCNSTAAIPASDARLRCAREVPPALRHRCLTAPQVFAQGGPSARVWE